MVRSNGLITEYYMPTVVKTLRVIECFNTVVLLFCLILFMKIINKREFCHRNLRVLLIFHPLTQWFSLFSRSLRHLTEAIEIITPLMADQFNMWMDIFIAAAYVMMLGFSVERIFAIIFVNRYEKMCSIIPWLGIVLVLFQLGGSFVLCVLLYTNVINVTLIYTLEVLTAVVTILFFALLPVLSRRAYRKIAKNKTSVSARYQTTQNVRVANMLKYLMPFMCISNDISLVGYNWSFEWTKEYYLPLHTQLYYTVYVSVQLFIELLIVCYCHPVLKQEFKKMFCGLKVADGNESVEQKDIRSFNGSQLIYSPHEEKEMYFNTYQAAWK